MINVIYVNYEYNRGVVHYSSQYSLWLYSKGYSYVNAQFSFPCMDCFVLFCLHNSKIISIITYLLSKLFIGFVVFSCIMVFLALHILLNSIISICILVKYIK